MTTLLKALHLLWPYIRMAIFRDRTVKEVLSEHKYVTIMLGLLLWVVFSLGVSTLKLAEVKAELQLHKELAAKATQCKCSPVIDGSLLDDILKRSTR